MGGRDKRTGLLEADLLRCTLTWLDPSMLDMESGECLFFECLLQIVHKSE